MKKNKNIPVKKRNPLRDWELYLFLLIPVVYVIIFKYVPMGGLVIAFKNYKVKQGIWGSDWVGLDNFIRFFKAYQFQRVLKNTIILSLYSLLASFPFPIIFALALNCLPKQKFAKISQTISAMPHFISTVVVVGMLYAIFSHTEGIYGNLMHMINGEYPSNIFLEPGNFRHLYVWSGIWQGFGWGSILYTAALTGVDPTYHEAAKLDGASRFQRVLYVDLPAIAPTIITMLILSMGSVMSIGFEKVFLLQNSVNLYTSQVISTFTYDVGLASSNSNFSYATAIGMFNNVIELILLIIVNKISKTVSETSLW